MWFEVLIPFGIVTVGVALPGFGLWWIHYFVNGNHYRRSLLDRFERSLYQRDLRLNGNPYEPNGLESIPDN